jgi:hypothetical protein
MSLTTTLAVRPPPATVRLDYTLLRRAFFVAAMFLFFVAPFSTDPIAFAAGAVVPWLVLRIVGTAALPAALVYFLIWQWLQIFARVLVSLVDGEQMARGVYGPWVEDAYWYMLASIIVLAIAFRAVLSGVRGPTLRQATAHLEWRPIDLFQVYVAAFVASSAAQVVADQFLALAQPLEALTRLKIVVIFVLFATVLNLGKGFGLLAIAVGAELVVGFTGIQSDFRSVFIILFMAAIAARVRWTGVTTILVGLSAGFLVLLGLFWTSVKGEFRQFATMSDDSQYIKVGLDARLGYIGGRFLAAGNTDWDFASYALLNRLAYVDIFGSVIGVKRVAPEQQASFQQWGDALAHVFQPRFLFPDKAVLSDLEVYIRLARGDASEQVRAGTSISVGYLAENFVDFDFPGMLGSVFLIGLIVAGMCRYFMSVPLPWMLREGIVMALVWAIGATGVEISLPKLFGGAFIGFVTYAILAKFALPFAVRWLDGRAAAAHQQESLRQQAKAVRQPWLVDRSNR